MLARTVTRLWTFIVALLILCFHRQIADFILEHERRLVIMLNQRGLRLPDVPSRELVRNVYFSIGAIFSVVTAPFRMADPTTALSATASADRAVSAWLAAGA